jgi:site-specific DNA-methyltransferase (adenine-specific)
MELDRIIHGDGLAVIEAIPDGVPVAIVTDPPYGIALANHGQADGRRRAESYRVPGDESQEVGQAALAIAERRGWPTIAFASPMRPWPGRWRQWLVWDKGAAVGGGGDIATCWKFSWELIQVARTPALTGPREGAVLRFAIGPNDSPLHPCQKPVSLLSYLIHKACAPGSVIVDPFAGSGSTCTAAKWLGYSYLGVESDAEYAAVAARRVAAHPRALF